MKSKERITFNKRFANGEQYLFIKTKLNKELKKEYEICAELKTYFWQERGIYNRILPIVALVKAKKPDLTESEIYGENGLVEQLIPIQRAYNAVKNRRMEYINRLAMGVLVVEDGSIDLDSLEEEGLSPGKAIVYRQGSRMPEFLNISSMPKEFEQAEKDLSNDFITIATLWLAK